MPQRPVLPRTLQTSRLVISHYVPEDAAAINAAVVGALDTLRPWMPWAQCAPTLAESAEFCLRSHAQFDAGSDFTLKLVLRSTGALIGSSGLHRRLERADAFEIGYWLHPDYVGQGYVSEAVTAIAAAGFEHLGATRLEIHAEETNLRSRAVPERLGWPRTGQLDHVNVAGEPTHMVVYTLCRPQAEPSTEERP